MRYMISRWIIGLRNGISSGAGSRSSKRAHALSNSAVTSAVLMARVSELADGEVKSSRLRISRTAGISSFSRMHRYGNFVSQLGLQLTPMNPGYARLIFGSFRSDRIRFLSQSIASLHYVRTERIPIFGRIRQ